LQQLLLDSLAECDVTVLMVTHSIEEAVFLGSRIWVLSGKPGRIRACFENPGQGGDGFRQMPEYHRMCTAVRRAMVEAPP
jgi:NitT/TauT family transport system ATP-binding protein